MSFQICILGKALGNGYAINAILGKKKLWIKQIIHLSVVFWSEASGFTVALKTLEIMKK